MAILHHTAITYGAPGGRFWRELKPSGAPSSLLLTLFVSTNQAYFMGCFFLLADPLVRLPGGAKRDVTAATSFGISGRETAIRP